MDFICQNDGIYGKNIQLLVFQTWFKRPGKAHLCQSVLIYKRLHAWLCINSIKYNYNLVYNQKEVRTRNSNAILNIISCFKNHESSIQVPPIDYFVFRPEILPSLLRFSRQPSALFRLVNILSFFKNQIEPSLFTFHFSPFFTLKIHHQ